MNRSGRKSPRVDQRGFSLIELMVSVTLGLAITLALSTVYIASKQSFRYQETSGRLQEDAGFALDAMAREVRMAGYAGCLGIDKITDTTTVYYPSGALRGSPVSPGITVEPDSGSGFYGANPLGQIEATNLEVVQQPFTPTNFFRGFDNGVPAGMVSASNPTPSTISDSLFFAGASANPVNVSVLMPTVTSDLTLSGDPFGWHNTVDAGSHNSGAYTFIASDCTFSSIFNGRVSVAGGITTIDHSATWGNNFGFFPADASATPVAASGYRFGTDAVVMPAQWSFYFIATRTGASTPSVYRVFFNGNKRLAAEEVISNVEAMKLNYGENTSPLVDPVTGNAVAPTLLTDVWRQNAASVTDWSRVTAVRIGLMMVTNEDNANAGVSLVTPKLLGQVYTPPAGASLTRVRKTFSTTVVLRNRVAARE